MTEQVRPGRVFLHIGAPKTASTTLQRSVFAHHPQVHYLGEEGEGWPSREDAAIVEKMIFADDLFYPADACARLFSDQLAVAANRAFIYSNGDIMTSRHPTVCAQRLHALLPDADVIIVLRNQFTALPSYWANHGAFLKPAPPQYFRRFVEFEDWLAWGIAFPHNTPFANFLYAEIIELYASLWGRNRIHLMLFEEFLSDKDAFVRRLARLMGIDEDKAVALAHGTHERRRYSARALAWHRLRTRYFWSLSLPRYMPGRQAVQRTWERFLLAGSPLKIEIPPALRAAVGGVFAPGNAQLVKTWGLNLARHGYPLPDFTRAPPIK